MYLVAIAYVMHKAPYIFPIIGGRKVEHLQANIEALNISLSEENLKFIDDVLPFDKGFPMSLFVRTPLTVLTYQWLMIHPVLLYNRASMDPDFILCL